MDRSSPEIVPARYETVIRSLGPIYRTIMPVWRDLFCHDLGSDGDVARVWIREHAIDPEALHNGSGEVGRDSECEVRSLGSCLGTMTNSGSKRLVLLNFWLPQLVAIRYWRSALGVLMRLCWRRDQPRRRIIICHQ